MEKHSESQKSFKDYLKYYYNKVVQSFKELHGNPHYLATGMGVGVFVGMTPTFPLHTIIALPLAHILRGSKRAAMLGVWISNPLTLPFCYYLAYKLGMLVLDKPSPFTALKLNSCTELLDLGMEIAGAMMLGGLILGVPLGILAYMITHHIAKITNSR